MDVSTAQKKLLEYDALLFSFKPEQEETADEEWIALLSSACEFIYQQYQEEENVFVGCRFHFEPVMHGNYLRVAHGLDNNIYLLQSEKVKAYLMGQLKNKKWLSGRATFLRPLIKLNDRKIINKIAKDMPDLWETHFVKVILMEAVTKMKIPGFRREVGEFLHIGEKKLVRRAETYLKNEEKYKPV